MATRATNNSLIPSNPKSNSRQVKSIARRPGSTPGILACGEDVKAALTDAAQVLLWPVFELGEWGGWKLFQGGAKVRRGLLPFRAWPHPGKNAATGEQATGKGSSHVRGTDSAYLDKVVAEAVLDIKHVLGGGRPSGVVHEGRVGALLIHEPYSFCYHYEQFEAMGVPVRFGSRLVTNRDPALVSEFKRRVEQAVYEQSDGKWGIEVGSWKWTPWALEASVVAASQVEELNDT